MTKPTRDRILGILLTLGILVCLLAYATACTSDCPSRHITDLPPMPVEPKWVTLDDEPLVYSTNSVWEASPGFVERGVQSIEWSDKVRRWKRENEVK